MFDSMWRVLVIAALVAGCVESPDSPAPYCAFRTQRVPGHITVHAWGTCDDAAVLVVALSGSGMVLAGQTTHVTCSPSFTIELDVHGNDDIVPSATLVLPDSRAIDCSRPE